MIDTAKIAKAAEEAQGGHGNMAFIGGICMGLAITDRYDLEEDDRIYLAKAGEYLRRASFGMYYTEHGKMP